MASIDAKDAVRIATEYFQFAVNSYSSRIVVEEIEQSPEKDKWIITVSAAENSFNPYKTEDARIQKIFEVNTESGDIVSMRNKC